MLRVNTGFGPPVARAPHLRLSPPVARAPHMTCRPPVEQVPHLRHRAPVRGAPDSVFWAARKRGGWGRNKKNKKKWYF